MDVFIQTVEIMGDMFFVGGSILPDVGTLLHKKGKYVIKILNLVLLQNQRYTVLQYP